MEGMAASTPLLVISRSMWMDHLLVRSPPSWVSSTPLWLCHGPCGWITAWLYHRPRELFHSPSGYITTLLVVIIIIVIITNTRMLVKSNSFTHIRSCPWLQYFRGWISPLMDAPSGTNWPRTVVNWYDPNCIYRYCYVLSECCIANLVATSPPAWIHHRLIKSPPSLFFHRTRCFFHRPCPV